MKIIKRKIKPFWETTILIVVLILSFSAISIMLITSTAFEEKKETLLSNARLLSKLIALDYQSDSLSNPKVQLDKTSREISFAEFQKAFDNFTKSDDGFEYLVGELHQDKIHMIAYSYKPHPDVDIKDLNEEIPMHLALQGHTGTIETYDHLGRYLLAAYIAIPETKWGLVVKKDIYHLTLPFYRTGLVIFVLTFLLAFIIFALTLTRERINQAQIQQHQTRFQQLVESAQDCIWETNAQWVYTYVSPQSYKLSGYEPHELIGKTPFDLTSKEESIRVRGLFEEHIKNAQAIIELEHSILHKNGDKVTLITSCTPFFDEQKKLLGYRGMDINITQRKKHEQEIAKMAYFDSLTGLANRIQIIQRIEEELAICERGQLITALLYLDLDSFKVINDSLGHDIGDKVLIKISHRIKSVLRPYDIAGRLGGDEFVVLLRCGEYDSGHLNLLLERMLHEINKQITVDSQLLNVSVSIGVALIPMDGKTTNELLRHADSAMYQAKNAGKNQYYFYHHDLQIEADEKLKVQQELKQAFENNQFKLYYQRQTNITGDKTVGLEALIRWQHPVKGFIPPNNLLDYIDEFNMTSQLDDWVIHQACWDIKNHLAPFLQNFTVSINVTPEIFNHNDFISRLTRHTENIGVQPEKLTLEVTEGSLIQDIENAYGIISTLSALGYKISLDDFGTGYSSLSYLSRIEFDTIKIDKSFIQKIETSQIDQNICKLIIGLAQDLDKYIVAEGVETQQQIDFLHELGVDKIQGFIYAKPQAIDALCQHLQDEQT